MTTKAFAFVFVLLLAPAIHAYSAGSTRSELKERTDKTMIEYIDCLLSYASLHAPTPATTDEIAAGAIEACEPSAKQYWQSMYDYAGASAQPNVAREVADEAGAYIRADAKDIVVSRVMKVRSQQRPEG